MRLTDQELEGLMDEWIHQTAVYSAKEQIVSGSAFTELMTAPPERLTRALLRRLRDDGPSVCYLFALHEITGQELWRPGGRPWWQGFDVDLTGEAWLAWGKEAGLIDDIGHAWESIEYGPSYRYVCFKCRERDWYSMSHQHEDTHTQVRVCPACGPLTCKITVERSYGEYDVKEFRIWRGRTGPEGG